MHPIDFSQYRNDFPILDQKINNKNLIYFDNAASTQKPIQVVNCIVNYYYRTHANVHRGNHYLSQLATSEFEAARKTVQNFINAKYNHEIIFTRGTTESINLLATVFGNSMINESDEIIITQMEHHSNIVPWQMMAESKNAILKVLPINDSGELILDQLDSLINSKTKLLAVTHVSNTLGTINPVKKIIEKAHHFEIPVMVDGAQAIPHLPVDVQQLDCDFYCFSGHKVYGPTGIGVFYGKEQWLDKLPPYHGGGEMIETVTFEKTTFNRLPFKFEAGTPNICDAIAFAEALKYVTFIGLDSIGKHEQMLLRSATSLLSEIEGLKIIGTAGKKSGVVSFIIEGIHSGDIGIILDKMGIAVRTGTHCTEPLMHFYKINGTVRASFALYNTMEEVEIFAEALKKTIKMLR